MTTPRGFAADATVPQDELAKRIDRECGWPAIVKPNSAGSSVGFSILHAPDDLKAAYGRSGQPGVRPRGSCSRSSFPGAR